MKITQVVEFDQAEHALIKQAFEADDLLFIPLDGERSGESSLYRTLDDGTPVDRELVQRVERTLMAPTVPMQHLTQGIALARMVCLRLESEVRYWQEQGQEHEAHTFLLGIRQRQQETMQQAEGLLNAAKVALSRAQDYTAPVVSRAV